MVKTVFTAAGVLRRTVKGTHGASATDIKTLLAHVDGYADGRVGVVVLVTIFTHASAQARSVVLAGTVRPAALDEPVWPIRVTRVDCRAGTGSRGIVALVA